MRLAEVYLDYAEAVTAAYGPTGRAPGADMTAVDAINRVRDRGRNAMLQPLQLNIQASWTLYGTNEMLNYVLKDITGRIHADGILLISWILIVSIFHLIKDWTTFNRSVLIRTKVFEDPKHYWLTHE